MSMTKIMLSINKADVSSTTGCVKHI